MAKSPAAVQEKRDPFGGCPVRATSAVMAGKWKVEALWHLAFGARRFAELRDLLPPVSEKVLSAQLRALERDGLVSRTEIARKPLHVEYALTCAGEELIVVMERMCGWGVKHRGVPPTLAGRPPLLDESRPACA